MADTQPKIDSGLEATAVAVPAVSADQAQQKEVKSVTIDDPKSDESSPAGEAAEGDESADKDAAGAAAGEEGEKKPKKESPVKKIVASLKGLFKCLPGRRESGEPKKKKKGGDQQEEDGAEGSGAQGKETLDADSVNDDDDRLPSAADAKKDDDKKMPELLPAVGGETADKKETEGGSIAPAGLTTTITAERANN